MQQGLLDAFYVLGDLPSLLEKGKKMNKLSKIYFGWVGLGLNNIIRIRENRLGFGLRFLILL